MSSQDIQLPLNSHWLDSVGWRTVGHCSTQSDKRVVRKSRQVYRTIVQSETRPNGGETSTSDLVKSWLAKNLFVVGVFASGKVQDFKSGFLLLRNIDETGQVNCDLKSTVFQF